MVDTPVSGTGAERCASSTLALGIRNADVFGVFCLLTDRPPSQIPLDLT